MQIDVSHAAAMDLSKQVFEVGKRTRRNLVNPPQRPPGNVVMGHGVTEAPAGMAHFTKNRGYAGQIGEHFERMGLAPPSQRPASAHRQQANPLLPVELAHDSSLACGVKCRRRPGIVLDDPL